MTQSISIEAVKLEGFRAYLRPQTIDLHRGRTTLSLAVFAANAKGKSSLVDAFEFYLSPEATLARLGKRSAQRHAGPVAMEHVDAEKTGVTPRVHFWFRQGDDKFDDERPVSAAAPPLPAAAKRVLAHTKSPFIIRGYELRSFVERTTPEERYRQIATWFALDPLLTIQENLRSLRRLTKQKMETSPEEAERLLDLKRTTGDAILTWDDARICAWFNTTVVAQLDETLALAELCAEDTGYQELVKRKNAEDERIGLAPLKRLLANIEALFIAPKDPAQDRAGSIAAFEASVISHAAAVTSEEQERSKASRVIFNRIWTASKALFDSKDAAVEACPVCDTDFASSPHGSRDKVRLSLETKLRDLADYRRAEEELMAAVSQLKEAARTLRATLSMAMSSLSDAGYGDRAKQVATYLQDVETWAVGDSPPDSAEAVKALQALHASITAAKVRTESLQRGHTYGNALRTINELLRIKTDLARINVPNLSSGSFTQSLIDRLWLSIRL